MTLATWKAQFYPIKASQCSEQDAIAHSLRKWRGMRAEKLALHGLAVNFISNLEGEDGSLVISSGTCALCVHHYDDSKWPDEVCEKCPLAISRGGVSCDNATDKESRSPFAAWDCDNDPEPMIAALEKAQGEQS